MFLQIFIPHDYNAGNQTASIVDTAFPEFVEIQGHAQILIFHECRSHERLRKKSDCCRVCSQCRNDLCMLGFVFNRHILLRIKPVRLQYRIQCIFRRCSFAAGIDCFPFQIRRRMDCIAIFHQIQYAQRIRSQYTNLLLRLLIKSRCKVCRNRCNIYLSLYNHRNHFIRRCYNRNIIVFIVKQLCHSHRSRAFHCTNVDHR